MKRSALLILILTLITTDAFSQNEASTWYFGNKAGLKFNRNNPDPVVLTDGALNTNEGCASVSDSSGNLIFYTDGKTVWNKNHEAMFEGLGLFGHQSSTQSAIIIPKPQSAGIYYIFTINALESLNKNIGFCYSMVDANYDNGKGRVTVINSVLFGAAIEKLTAVKHANKVDYWIILHESGSNKFYSFRLFPGYIDRFNPVVSSVGSVLVRDSGTIGYLKTSPDGRKIAMATYTQNTVELFDFNNETGVVSNPVIISNQEMGYAYGVEFSPSGKYLYVSTTELPSRIFQFAISSGNKTEILNSEYLVYESSDDCYGALQIAPNGQIYIAKNDDDYLASIKFPDDSSFYCGFSDNAVDLKGRISYRGLPNFTASIFDYQTELSSNSPVCEGDTLKLSAYFPPYVHFVEFGWTGPSGFESKDQNPVIADATASMSGTYTFRTRMDNGKSFLDSISIKVHAKPNFKFSEEMISICSGESEIIKINNLDNAKLNYLWSTGDTTNSIEVSKGGIYSVTATNVSGCTETKQVIVIENPKPEFDILPGKSILLCSKESIELSPSMDFEKYEWSNGSNNKSILVNQTGVYTLTVTDINGCTSSESATLIAFPEPDVRIIGDNYLCRDSFIELQANSNFKKYEWSTGETTKKIKITSPGEYSLTITDSNECIKTVTHFVNEIIVNITGFESIDFGKVLAGEPATHTFTIRNDGNQPVVVKSITRQNSTSPFVVYSYPSYPHGLDVGKSMNVTVFFEPYLLDIYKDTLVLEISSPCQRKLKVFLGGTAYGKTLIWIPDTVAMPGINNFCIPIRSRAVNNFSVQYPPAFSCEFMFHVSAFYPSGPTNGYPEGDYRVIPMSHSGIEPTLNTKEIFRICGLVMLADSDVVELKIRNFRWMNPLLEVETRNGSLRIFLCQETIGRIKSYTQTSYNISPNPAESDITIKINSEESGAFGFYIYDTQGACLLTEVWSSTGKHEKIINPDIVTIPTGVYQALLRTPSGFVSKPLVIVK